MSHEDGGHGPHLPARLVHGKTTNAILAAAYKIHSRLGPGLLESTYKVCLSHELTVAGIEHEREKALPARYDGMLLDIGYRVDLIVENLVIVEIKAVDALLPVHESQLLSYLRLSGKRVGLLINFNVAHLRDGIRRRILGYYDDRDLRR